MALKKHFLKFLRHVPGTRFQHYYHLINRRINHNIFIKIFLTFLGAISLLIGFVLLFIPGPGVLFLAIGVVLICLSSQSVAVVLDRWEDKIQKKIQAWRSNNH